MKLKRLLTWNSSKSMSNYHRYFLLIALSVLTVAISAEEYPQPVELFEGAILINEERISTRNYSLALGPYEKSGNLWQAEEKQRIAGNVLKQTHEIPRDFSVQDAFEFYIDVLGGNAKVLYQCESFNCGASNNWANVHFDIKQLYGLDRHQFYQVTELENGDFATVYVVRRGNRRIFAQIEIIRPLN